eukprot:Clim_evm9s81 gene=Clim_evmTU9s81
MSSAAVYVVLKAILIVTNFVVGGLLVDSELFALREVEFLTAVGFNENLNDGTVEFFLDPGEKLLTTRQQTVVTGLAVGALLGGSLAFLLLVAHGYFSIMVSSEITSHFLLTSTVLAALWAAVLLSLTSAFTAVFVSDKIFFAPEADAIDGDNGGIATVPLSIFNSDFPNRNDYITIVVFGFLSGLLWIFDAITNLGYTSSHRRAEGGAAVKDTV